MINIHMYVITNTYIIHINTYYTYTHTYTKTPGVRGLG